MREPRWSSGAYTSPPHVTVSAGEFVGRAQIECWRGTPAEFMTVINAIASELTSFEVVSEVEWIDGTKSRARGFVAIGKDLRAGSGTRSIQVRLSQTGVDGIKSLVRAQRSIPGVSIETKGPDQQSVAALTQKAFGRAMIGYVDRLGAWRAPALAGFTVGVPGVAMMLLPDAHSAWTRAGGSVAILGWLALSFFVIWPALLAARAFVLVDSVERHSSLGSLRGRTARSRRRVRVWALGTVGGVLLVGLLINGLSAAFEAGIRWLGALFFG